MSPEHQSPLNLKNLQFLTPHLPKLEEDLQSLLFEIDQLIEKKKNDWKKDFASIKSQISENGDVSEPCKDKNRMSSAFHLIPRPGFPKNYDVDQLSHLKCTIEWMRRNYESLKSAYDKQIAAEKEKSRQALQKFEKDNRTLLLELKSLRENNRTKTEVLATQLSDEKTRATQLSERCTELEARLHSCQADLEREREEQCKLQRTMHQRQSEMDTLLQKANLTVDLQKKELSQLKSVLSRKEEELSYLNSSFSASESELIASKEVVHRLERTVSRHLSLLSRHKDFSGTHPSGSGDVLDADSGYDKQGLGGKLYKLEHQLRVAQQSLQDKIHEFGRLKSACNVASLTIRKLCDSKALSDQQMSSVCRSLRDVLHATEGIYACIGKVKQVAFDRVKDSEERLRYLAQSVHEIKSRQLASKKCDILCDMAVQSDTPSSFNPVIAVQTEAEYIVPLDYWPGNKVQLLRDDWLSSVQKLQEQIDFLVEERSGLVAQLEQQTARLQDLERDNLALTDLLTGAEKFNRTPIACASFTHDRGVQATGVGSPPPIPANSLRQSLDGVSDSTDLPASSTPIRRCSPVLTSTPFHGRQSRDQSAARETVGPPSGMPAYAESHDLEGLHSPDSSAFSISPAEFGEFVLSDPRALRPGEATPSGDAWNATECPTSTIRSCTPIVRQTSGERRKEHVRFNSNPEIYHLDANNSAFVTSQAEEKQSSPCALQSRLRNPISKVTKPRRDIDEYEDDVCDLAEKFLADERQHSRRLEQQIDLHLDELKRRIGL